MTLPYIGAVENGTINDDLHLLMKNVPLVGGGRSASAAVLVLALVGLLVAVLVILVLGVLRAVLGLVLILILIVHHATSEKSMVTCAPDYHALFFRIYPWV